MSFAFCRYLEAFILTYEDTHNFFIVVHGGSSGTASAMNDNQMKNVLSRMGSERDLPDIEECSLVFGRSLYGSDG